MFGSYQSAHPYLQNQLFVGHARELGQVLGVEKILCGLCVRYGDEMRFVKFCQFSKFFGGFWLWWSKMVFSQIPDEVHGKCRFLISHPIT